MDPPLPPTSNTTPQFLIPNQSVQNPNDPLAPKPKSYKIPLILTSVVILLVFGGVFITLVLKSHLAQPFVPHVTNTKPPLSLANETVDIQTSALAKAFKNGDFQVIVSYLKEKVPNNEWIKNKEVVDSGIFYATDSAQFKIASVSANIQAKIIAINNSPAIELDPALKDEQPYAASAVVLRYLNFLYYTLINYSGSVSASDCLNQNLTVFQNEIDFWDALSPQQRSPIEGFTNAQQSSIEERYESYKSNPDSLRQWVDSHLTRVCQSTQSNLFNSQGGQR